MDCWYIVAFTLPSQFTLYCCFPICFLLHRIRRDITNPTMPATPWATVVKVETQEHSKGWQKDQLYKPALQCISDHVLSSCACAWWEESVRVAKAGHSIWGTLRRPLPEPDNDLLTGADEGVEGGEWFAEDEVAWPGVVEYSSKACQFCQ